MGFVKNILLIFIRTYRFAFSALFGNCCRFEPTCSAYALEAIQTRGCFRGSWLVLKRLARCHPWSSGGVDLVP